ncbi:choice-of-anchor Q domain-containing protein [Carboxylicivirga taeanensis]|uniref:choice-of-anchor Q domain-containing protein n=1 Tax=Carboxylicivirga taeanensis TaxID=1416875 RepID=UPI003F6DDA0E
MSRTVFFLLLVITSIFYVGCEQDAIIDESGPTVPEEKPDEILPPSMGKFPTPGLLETPISSSEIKSTDGTQYYVANVSTNGDGTKANPFNDINNALAIAEPGDQIYVKSGTYLINSRIATMNDATQEKPILIEAEDLYDRPILKRAPGYGGEIFLIRNQYYIVSGFVMDGSWAHEDFNMKYWNEELQLNERAFRELVVFAHYGMPREVDGQSISFDNYLGYNGDNSTLRNCEVKNAKVGGVTVAADNITIENCEIHHILRGSENGPVDAHAITGTHCNNLKIIHCDIHHASGDCLQVDPDRYNKCAEKLWDNLTVEHTRLWTGPLAQNSGDWSAGASPGENGIDTKTYENEPLTHRPKVTITNILVHDFAKVPFFSNRSVFNVKYQTDWTFNAVTAYNNQFVFRMRGEVNNEEQGGAHATIHNVLAFNNEYVFRFERMIKNMTITHATCGPNDNFFFHDQGERNDDGETWAADLDTYVMKNCLFYSDTKPYEAFDASNMIADEDDFVDMSANNFRLAGGAAAINGGDVISGLGNDITGNTRVQSERPDVGAYEAQ